MNIVAKTPAKQPNDPPNDAAQQRLRGGVLRCGGCAAVLRGCCFIPFRLLDVLAILLADVLKTSPLSKTYT